MTVIVPVFKGLAITRACIDSVLAHRDPALDALLLIDDASPDPGIAELLAAYTAEPNVFVLTNAENLGFVRSVNRGLAAVTEGDALLLNSDTRVFAGGLTELHAAANSSAGIGTATPLSNNATIFSYPVCNQGSDWLGDISFEQAAEDALAGGRGQVFDVPTGHGFCLYITRVALDRVGLLDEAFGRGYGEENDFCQRCADLGLRNVAAAGVLVEHRESVSFSEEKAALLHKNLALLDARYPDYATAVRDCLARDDLRAARWPIDTARLARAGARGERFVLVLRNWLGGGTRQAIQDIECRVGYDGAHALDLCVSEDGTMRLACGDPRLRAVFAAAEVAPLFDLLAAAPVDRIFVHQVLGYSEAFIRALIAFGARRDLRVVLHDYYMLCPRVTLIDASDRFCGVAETGQCARCLALGGPHPASRLDTLSPAAHRHLMGALLAAARGVSAPSASTAGMVRRAFPGLAIAVEPHPEPAGAYEVPARAGDARNIVLLGAIGAHKGAETLRAVAATARLVAPSLVFHVIGHTPFDDALRALGNVSVSGEYRPHALPRLVAAANGCIALFLHNWPETFSYTLSEAVQLGLVPLVPDIGAPAERVRRAGFGHVFGFPVNPAEVVALLAEFAAGARPLVPAGASPASFAVRI